jgi:hypothetical protein
MRKPAALAPHGLKNPSGRSGVSASRPARGKSFELTWRTAIELVADQLLAAQGCAGASPETEA